MFIKVEYWRSGEQKNWFHFSNIEYPNFFKAAYAKINYVKDTLDKLEFPLFHKGTELKKESL